MEGKLLGKTMTAAEWLDFDFTFGQANMGFIAINNRDFAFRRIPETNCVRISGCRLSSDIVVLGVSRLIEADTVLTMYITQDGKLGLKTVEK